MKPSWFVKGDIDGFFGLFVDNLLQLMLMVALCPFFCGIPAGEVVTKILPGAAISIFLGNLFYSWQAYQLAKKNGRRDITALPYGINTPSLVAFIFLVMAPVYRETQNPTLAWQAGLFACFLSGVMETIGAFIAEPIRRHTPRAALLSALAGIAITFIAMGFIFQAFASPMIALVPTLMILTNYASGRKFPIGLPGGLAAVLVGVGLAWILRSMGIGSWAPPPEAGQAGFYPPQLAFGSLFEMLGSRQGWQFFGIIFPMGLFNIVGSLQNLESAEAAGDRFETKPSLLANGLGSLVASFLGSPFPTTIYIGHPGWKAMGARIGYSAINGVVITLLCLCGAVSLILKVVPLEATLGILFWIAIFMTAQAFQEVPKKHALAVAFGLVPSLGAWAYFLIETTLSIAGSSMHAMKDKFGNQIFIEGVIALNQGFIVLAMIYSALLVFIIERNFLRAGLWCVVAALLSAAGIIHAYQLGPGGLQMKYGLLASPHFAVSYLAGALFLFAFHAWQKRFKEPQGTSPEGMHQEQKMG